MTKIDTLLYWYTLIFSTALIITALNNGFTLSRLTTVAFFLPVPIFLLLQALKRYYLWKQSALDSESPSLNHPALTTFNFKSFLTQTNPVFIITLVLLITTILINLITAL